MRRSTAGRICGLLILMLALVLVVAPATAGPSGGKWKGTEVELGKNLKFKVDGSKIKKISAQVTEYCDGDLFDGRYTSFAPDSSWKIHNNKFSGRHKEQSHGVTVYFTFEGKFTSKTKAKGKLREESIVAGSVCDTYELDWKAKLDH